MYSIHVGKDAVLGYYAAYNFNPSTTFREKPIGPFFKKLLTLEDGTDRFYRNVVKDLAL